MKTVLFLLLPLLGMTPVTDAQTAQRSVQSPTRTRTPAARPSQPGMVTLFNNTKDVLNFQLRYNVAGAQWAGYQLVSGERRVLSVKGTFLNLYMPNITKQPLTYSLQAGNTYQFYWSVSRSMYDVDLVR